MPIKKYDELNSLQIDTLKEIGSIGAGNAATSLSGAIGQKIAMSVPEVKILENNEAIKKFGGPEKIISGILVKFSGDIEGIVLYMQTLEFVNIVLKNTLSQTAVSYEQLTEMEISALIEIGNIMISSYINAIVGLSGLNIELSVPAICINMLGSILSVPMAEYGYETDKIMLIDGKIICGGQMTDGNLIMIPNINSLNVLLQRLNIEGF